MLARKLASCAWVSILTRKEGKAKGIKHIERKDIPIQPILKALPKERFHYLKINPKVEEKKAYARADCLPLL